MTPFQLEEYLQQAQEAQETGHFAQAARAFGAAAEALPSEVALWQMQANAWTLAGDLLAARRALLQAFHRGSWSDTATAHALTAALLDAGAPAEAVTCAERVCAAVPKDPAALAALAAALRMSGAPEAAWPLVERAARLAPKLPAVLLTAAQVRHDLGDFAGARRWAHRSLSLRPGHGPTRVQLAYSSLIEGARAEGWRHFEARALPTPETTARSWAGEPLDGGSVLVTVEQGVGDLFQFLRFVDRLKDHGAGYIVTQCHADAMSLLKSNGFAVVSRAEAPPTDWQVPLMSLPHRLGLGGDVAHAGGPYLRSDGEPQLPREDGRLNLGLVWAGNPAFPGGYTRDLDPSLLPDIIAIPGVRWWSLQHGTAGATELPGLHQLPKRTDWADTAHALASLDGLVTTDTGIAHLAGAMGVPTWVLLQHIPDWRWGVAGDQTPWYPSVRLVRPERWMHWGSVVTRLAHALQEAHPWPA